MHQLSLDLEKYRNTLGTRKKQSCTSVWFRFLCLHLGGLLTTNRREKRVVCDKLPSSLWRKVCPLSVDQLVSSRAQHHLRSADKQQRKAALRCARKVGM